MTVVGIAVLGHGGAVVAHARHAEGLGLESLRHGDHLIPVNPHPGSTPAPATAAARTWIKLGFDPGRVATPTLPSVSPDVNPIGVFGWPLFG
ncbi:hypothetical protein [Saccharothrix algeriensis]|uniref:Uncharacterized protein n=1 Tax=Saccharothrix algeriensis TaxID=173560 RepID=A0A8T8HVC1_9PSEU|nr:hypothetical protein [Saccharothrix algeriensis]MBM7813927.1 hypothetical protein [Saccharothrix algeriensis]QTR02351.1 hypothetical protein J7S33_24830 [Saccharothrix algeriensis]